MKLLISFTSPISVECFIRRTCLQDVPTLFRGGESEALKKLKESIKDKVQQNVSLLCSVGMEIIFNTKAMPRHMYHHTSTCGYDA